MATPHSPDDRENIDDEDDGTERRVAAPPPSSSRSKWLLLLPVGGGLALPLVVLFLVPVLVIVLALGVISTIFGSAGMSDDCVTGSANNNANANMPIGEQQRQTARAYIGVAKALGVPREGQVIIAMAGFQESGLRVLSNTNVPNSMNIPHTGQGSDHDSVGSLQQRVSGDYSPYPDRPKDDPENIKWLMDNEYAAAAFFGGPQSPSGHKGLLDIPGWQSLPPGQAAQDVQSSGVPDGYNKWEEQANALVNSLQDAPPVDLSRWKNRAGKPAGGVAGESSSTSAPSAAVEAGYAADSSSTVPGESAAPGAQPAPGGAKVEPAKPVPGDPAGSGTVTTVADTGGGSNTLTGRDASTDPGQLPTAPNENGLNINAVHVGRAVLASFPTVKDIGGLRQGDPGDHGKGLARDIMIPAWQTPAGKALGDNIVQYLQLNHESLGITYLMWRHQYWDPNQGWSWVADRGSPTENHMDHVHASVQPQPASGNVTGSGNSPNSDQQAQGTADCSGSDGTGDVGNAKGVVAAALRWVGTDYAWGGGDRTGPTKGIRDGGVADSFGDYMKIGFDCSGLMEFAYWAGAHMSIGGTTYEQYPSTRKDQVGGGDMTPAQMKPGDLIFYGGDLHHVAMYIGGGKIVEAPESGSKVHVVAWSKRDQYAVTRPLGDKADANTGGDAQQAQQVSTDRINLPPQNGDPTVEDWDKLAQCESNGNWAIDSGNGFYGGIQFDAGTWTANGGGKYGPTANKASKEQQIEIATKVFRERGWAPWPACGKSLPDRRSSRGA